MARSRVPAVEITRILHHLGTGRRTQAQASLLSSTSDGARESTTAAKRIAIAHAGWWDQDNLDLILASSDVRAKRLIKIIRSQHFAIIGPYRSFPCHHDVAHLGLRDVRPGESAKRLKDVYAGDNTAAKLIGTAVSGSKQKMLIRHNRAAWNHLRSTVSHLGFQPVVAAAAFQEQGGVLGSEPTLLLPGHSRTGVLLAKVLMVRWAKQYNQDSFIYAGPETNGEIHLFTVVSRGVRGLPTRYSCQVSLGRSDQSTGIKTLIRRLYASAE